MPLSLPNFPTDNLYKFISIFGLTLSFACWILHVLFFGYNLQTMNDFDTDVNNLSDSIYQYALDNNLNLQDSFLLIPHLDSVNIFLHNDTFELNCSLGGQIRLTPKEYNLYKINRSLKEKETLREQIIWQAKGLSVHLNYGFFVGIGLAFFGFYWWYRNVQYVQDVISMKEAGITRSRFQKNPVTSSMFFVIVISLIICIFTILNQFNFFHILNGIFE